ncbi:MAG: SusC/RagA family TonB-linked outer membrane protein [Bacteroides sp.]|nr:SusC/RagA family TonB-linked outer membrane protein [Bacteroides sp.]
MQVSYIGMVAQEVVIAPNVKVILKTDAEVLDEVVVTAMGISKEKKALGYAVQDVKGDKLTQASSTNLASALQGKVSGVEISPSSGMPGASSKMTIRGSRSFTGDNTPLYVVDGMPISSSADLSTNNSVTGSDYANRAVDIDPNDIESINILKGQAASALYGMRASNGVIIITTKSGKGAGQGKPDVTINTGLSFDKVSTMPDFQTEFAQGFKGAFGPTDSRSWGPKISDLANDPNYGGNTQNKYTDQFGKREGQYYVPQRATAGLDPWATPRVYNNAKDFFNTAATWNSSVNVAQSLDKGSYSFSLGNTNASGIVPSTGMDRYNAKMTAQTQLNKNWSTGFNGNFVYSKIKKQTGANNGIMATVYGAPASYDLGGIPSFVEGQPYKQNTYRSTGGFDGAYWAVDNNSFTERTQRFFGNAFAQYSTKFGTENHKLDVKYQLGVDAYTTNYTDIWGYGHSNGTGSAEEQTVTSNEMNSLFTVAYDWKITQDLDLNFLYGNELVEKATKYKDNIGNNFNFPGWNHISNASVYTSISTYHRERTVGNFANLSLSYLNMLYFNATVRNDIVSSMPRNNRSFTYPSVSLGFIFTELEALQNDVLTFGKLRVSYAEVGQAGTYYPSYYRTPGYGGGFSSGTPIQYPLGGIMAFTPSSRLYDPSLRPQNTRSYEIGTDFAFWNGLVSLNYTYSRQNVKDQIFEVPLAASTGYGVLVTNGGSVHTNAHEFTVSVNPIKTKNINWDFAFNFSKIDNYVDKLAPGVSSIMLGGFVDPQVRLSAGDKFPVIYGTSYERNDNGDIVVDKNGLPIKGEDRVLGNVSPDFRLGFNTALELYKFRLSAVLDWKQGGVMYAGTVSTLDYYGVTQKSADYRNMESFLFEKYAVKQLADGSYAPNDINIKGSAAYDYFDRLSTISEAGVFGSSFLKLREISLSYPVLNKSFLKVTANVFARNILLWSEMNNGIDPESSQGNNNMAGAFERFSLPGTSSYGFGLTVKF